MNRAVQKKQAAPSSHAQFTKPPILLFLACEGPTEVKYLPHALNKYLSEESRHVKVTRATASGTDATSLVKKAEEFEAHPGKGDRYVWIVCDRDYRSRDEMEALAAWLCGKKKRGIHRRLAFTNLCLEYWFLLHFEACPKKFNRPEEYVAALKVHLPGYSKEQRSKIPTKLLEPELIKVARDRALARQQELGVAGMSPMRSHREAMWKTRNVTTMDKLFDEAKALANKRGVPRQQT